MSTKIFVGRLAEGISSDDIRALFRKFGAVTECDVISNYGFVVSIICSRIVVTAYKELLYNFSILHSFALTAVSNRCGNVMI